MKLNYSACLYSKFISDRESRRSLTNSHLEKKKCDDYVSVIIMKFADLFESHKLGQMFLMHVASYQKYSYLYSPGYSMDPVCFLLKPILENNQTTK